MTGIPQAIQIEWLRQALRLPEGESPLPWQVELLTRLRSGAIERALDIPTGLGKTAVMAIWLVARAEGAPLPRRLVYVVDRRAVVDQATTVAEGLRAFVEEHVDVKRALGLTGRKLPISTLRGQHLDNHEWLDDPAAPAIVVGTVDMAGSRLLFGGYGASRKMRPYHAGLLGTDALVVLDEAHLVPPFEKLLEAISEERAGDGARESHPEPLIPPFHLLSLSATGRPSSGRAAFGLQAEDLKHPVVRQRLEVEKHVKVTQFSANTKLEEELAAMAWSLSNEGRTPSRIIVYSDKRKVAQAAEAALRRVAGGDTTQHDRQMTTASIRNF